MFRYLPLLALTACITPGRTIHTIAQNPSGVTYRYFSAWTRELPAAVQKAEAHCAASGFHARLNRTERLDENYSLAFFDCVR